MAPRNTTTRSTAAETDNAGTQPERGGEADTTHAERGDAGSAPEAGTLATGSTIEGEMQSAERDQLDEAEEIGAPRKDAPRTSESLVSGMAAGSVHDPKALAAALPAGFGAADGYDDAARDAADRDPIDVARDALADGGRLTRHSSGLWGAVDGPVTSTSTGNVVPVAPITDAVIAQLVDEGAAREVESLRGRARTVEGVAPVEEPASKSPS